MSTILVNTLTGTSTAGSIAVTGEGNSTTTNLQQGLAKTWVNFNGSTIAIRTSLNVSSLTDNGAGDHTVVVANDFSDEPAANMTSGRNNFYYSSTGNTSNIRMQSMTAGTSTPADTTIIAMSAHGDLL